MPFSIFDSDIFIQYIYETLSIFHNKELIQTGSHISYLGKKSEIKTIHCKSEALFIKNI